MGCYPLLRKKYVFGGRNNYWWDGKTNTKLACYCTRECVIVTRQCQELKKFSQKVGLLPNPI